MVYDPGGYLVAMKNLRWPGTPALFYMRRQALGGCHCRG